MGVRARDVIVDSLPPGGLGGTQYANGAAKGTETGNLAMGSDGTLIRAVTADAAGHLQVDVLSAPSTIVTATHLDVRHLTTADDAVVVADGGNTITVDNGGTFAVQAALAASVAAADGQAYGTGILVQGDDGTDRRSILVGTDGHVQVDVLSEPAVRALTSADVVTVTGGAGQTADVKVTLDGEGVTGTVTVQDGGGAITVDNGGTFAVQAALAAAVAAADGQAYGTGILVQGDDGTDRRAILVGTDGHVQVDVLSAPAVTGTVTVQDGGGAITVDGSVTVVDGGGALTVDGTVSAVAAGVVADDAAASGNPILLGAVAVETDGTDPTSVSAEGDLAYLRTDRSRRLMVSRQHPSNTVAFHDETVAQTDHEIIAAPAAGVCIYVTRICVSNGATAGTVKFEEATAGAKTQKHGTLYLAINGGCELDLGACPIKCTAATNFGFTSVTMTTHSVTVAYYLAP